MEGRLWVIELEGALLGNFPERALAVRKEALLSLVFAKDCVSLLNMREFCSKFDNYSLPSL